ncbi:MAG: hypothetical protein ACRDZU_16425 [Acidimicrobiales bacterium]
MRAPTIVTVSLAGVAALALAAAAFGAAFAVPDSPPPVHLSDYVADLRETPPPAASAAILAEVTGVSVPSAVDHDRGTSGQGPSDSVPTTTPTSFDDHRDDPAESSSGPGPGTTTEPDDDSSGSGSGGEDTREPDDPEGSSGSGSSGPSLDDGSSGSGSSGPD